MLPVRAATIALQRAQMQIALAATRRAISNAGPQFDDISTVNGAPRYPSPWNRWFPHDPIPFSPKLGPYKVTCEQFQVYHFCTCGESRNQPWCEDAGSGTACSVNPAFKSERYEPRFTGSKLLCGCKKSPQGVMCSGTCGLVWADVNIVSACAVVLCSSFVGSIFLSWFIHP